MAKRAPVGRRTSRPRVARATASSPGDPFADSERLLHYVLNNVQDLVVLLDLKGRRLYNNPAYKDLLGDPRALRGTDSFTDIHPADRDRIKEVFRRTIKTGEGQKAEYRFVAKDGSVRYIESQGNLVQGSGNLPPRVVVVSKDVTEQRQAEQRLRLLARAVTCTKDCISITDLQDHILFVNDAFVSTYGYSEEELLGRDIALVRSPGTPSETAGQILAATRAGGWNGVALHRRKDGEEFPVELWTSLIRDDEGVPVAMVGVARDITDRKRAEENLDESLSILRATLESTADGILMVDRAGHMVTFNRKFAEIWRIPDAILNTREDRKALEFVLGQLEDPQQFLKKVEELYAQPDAESFDVLLFKDGRTVERYSGPLTVGNRSVGRVWSFRDVTERRRAEERLARVNESLLNLGPDPDANIQQLTALCGEMMHATCALYNRLERGMLCSLGQWNTPAEYNPVDSPDGHICYDVIKNVRDDVLVVRDLPSTVYAATDPNVARLGLRTYIGTPVTVGGAAVGSLCVVFQADVAPNEDDKRFLGIVASAVGIEERRKRAQKIQTATYRISQSAHTTDNLQELYRALHGIVGELMPADNIYIALHEPSSGLLSFPYFVDQYDAPPEPRMPGRGLTEYVLRTGKPLLATPTVFADLVAQGEVEMIGAPSVDWLGVPLSTREKPFGVLVLQTYSEDVRLGDEEKDILMFVSTQVAMAIERKKTDEALRASEHRHRDLAELLPQTIFEADAEGTLTFVNRHALLAFRYSQGDLAKGLNVLEMIDPAERVGARRQLREAMNGTALTGTEYTMIRKDGTTFPGAVYASPMFDGDQLAGFRGIVLDITERRRADEERARLTSAVEQAAESIVVTSHEGTILYVNPAFERVTGYKREEVLGKNPRILKSGVHSTEFYAGMWSMLAKGEVWSGHITNKRKDGNLYEEEMVISPVRDSQGTIANFVAVKRDVTRERTMERQLRQSQKMESLGQLASGIAHDFNNVLGVIQGSLALLRTRIGDPALARYVEMAETAVNRGADVAKRLLTFSRQEKVQLRPLGLADVVNEVLKVLEHTIEKTVVISKDIPPDLPIVQGDQGQLYQMLLNLCINARDALVESPSGAKGGAITISARRVEGKTVHVRFKEATGAEYVRLSVTDTGIGMTDDIRQRIFEPFFTTKPIGKGTGLGLAVVYGIVRSHNGFIEVETEVGSGTTFHVYLLAYPTQMHPQVEKKEAVLVGGSETVLVIEDEQALLDLLVELLTSFGYSVVKAEDGIDGLEIFRERQQDIAAVITDMGLPRMSGYDMFVRIREIRPTARVILASGYLDPSLKSKLFVAGAKAFIQKPYQPAEILRVLREVLDLPS